MPYFSSLLNTFTVYMMIYILTPKPVMAIWCMESLTDLMMSSMVAKASSNSAVPSPLLHFNISWKTGRMKGLERFELPQCQYQSVQLKVLKFKMYPLAYASHLDHILLNPTKQIKNIGLYSWYCTRCVVYFKLIFIHDFMSHDFISLMLLKRVTVGTFVL